MDYAFYHVTTIDDKKNMNLSSVGMSHLQKSGDVILFLFFRYLQKRLFCFLFFGFGLLRSQSSYFVAVIWGFAFFSLMFRFVFVFV